MIIGKKKNKVLTTAVKTISYICTFIGMVWTSFFISAVISRMITMSADVIVFVAFCIFLLISVFMIVEKNNR